MLIRTEELERKKLRHEEVHVRRIFLENNGGKIRRVESWNDRSTGQSVDGTTGFRNNRSLLKLLRVIMKKKKKKKKRKRKERELWLSSNRRGSSPNNDSPHPFLPSSRILHEGPPSP